MAKLPQKVINQLKKPLGKLYKDFREIRKLSKNHRIIAVGDVCTLGLLAMGIKPHLAVFDFRLMRQDLGPEIQGILRLYFKNPKKYKNPAGTISERIVVDAADLIENGGAVLIDGEEDLTALAFILKAGNKDVVVYGQPHLGIVIVKPDKKLKKKVENWLAASSFGHKVKGDK